MDNPIQQLRCHHLKHLKYSCFHSLSPTHDHASCNKEMKPRSTKVRHKNKWSDFHTFERFCTRHFNHRPRVVQTGRAHKLIEEEGQKNKSIKSNNYLRCQFVQRQHKDGDARDWGKRTYLKAQGAKSFDSIY